MSIMSSFSELNFSSFLEADFSKENSNNSNASKCEFIPIDLEAGIEEALNEPLPDVMLIDESESNVVPLKDVTEITVTSNTIENIKPITPISNISNLNIKTIPAVVIDSEFQKNKFEKNSYESEVDSLIKAFDADLELGTESLPLRTPVKKFMFDKENFLNPQNNLSLNTIRSNHMISTRLRTPRLTAPNDQYATPIGLKQHTQLLKHVEPLSSSKIPIGKPANPKFSKMKVNLIEYTVLKIVGRGGSSVVYQCFNCASKENRAIKCVSLESPSSCEGYMKEIEVLKKLQGCDRIIKMFDYEIIKQEKKLYVVLEMGSADLAQILRDLSMYEKVVPPYLIIFYWMEMLYAVQQIHCHGIIHSDLKPANFLQVNGRLKLIDFGISSCLQNDSTSVIKTVSEGSSSYISPEALNCEYSNNRASPNYGKPKYKISYKADVWSLGCILYQLIYKKTPFEYISNQMQKLMAIANSSVKIEYPQNDKIPQKFIETVKKCLIHNAKSRPSVDELISEYDQFCTV